MAGPSNTIGDEQGTWRYMCFLTIVAPLLVAIGESSTLYVQNMQSSHNVMQAMGAASATASSESRSSGWFPARIGNPLCGQDFRDALYPHRPDLPACTGAQAFKAV